MKFAIKLSAIFLFMTFNSTNSNAFTLLASSVTAGWDTTTLAFAVNDSSCTALGISTTTLYAAIDAAVALWNSAPTSGIKLSRGASVTSVTSTNPPTIYCSNVGQTAGIAGVGTIAQTSNGHPSSGSLALNGDSTKSAYFNTLSATYQSIVVAHEIGHVLGLGHSEKVYALMYYDISSKTNLNLSQDDVDGITWLNPRSEPGSGIMGCGSVRNVSDRNDRMPPPPSGGSGGVIFNWALVILAAFAASRFKCSKVN
jgi:hypothetical protein